MKFFRGATPLEIIAVRLDPGDDVQQSLARVARDLSLVAGAVVSGSGTLGYIALESPVTETYPPAVQAVTKSGPGHLVAAQGLVATEGIQVTVTVARRGEVYCGQVVEGCTVLHGAEFVLLRAGGTRWAFPPSDETGIPSLQAVAPPGGAAVSLMGRPVDVNAVAMVPGTLIRKHGALPVARTADTLVVAMADPNNPFAIDDLRAASGLRVQPVAAPPAELLRAIEQALSG